MPKHPAEPLEKTAEAKAHHSKATLPHQTDAALRWWCIQAFKFQNKMADAYDVDDTGGWDATHEAAAAAAAAHAAGELSWCW